MIVKRDNLKLALTRPDESSFHTANSLEAIFSLVNLTNWFGCNSPNKSRLKKPLFDMSLIWVTMALTLYLYFALTPSQNLQSSSSMSIARDLISLAETITSSLPLVLPVRASLSTFLTDILVGSGLFNWLTVLLMPDDMMNDEPAPQGLLTSSTSFFWPKSLAAIDLISFVRAGLSLNEGGNILLSASTFFSFSK